jgi:ribose-phosphate pyrophosphokinase
MLKLINRINLNQKYFILNESFIFRDNIKIFSGSANVELAKEICERLGLDLGKSTLKLRTDGELNITINESVRGMDTYIIQPTCNPTNDNLIELFLMISLFKRLSAKKITAVIPYYGYGRAVYIFFLINLG